MAKHSQSSPWQHHSILPSSSQYPAAPGWLAAINDTLLVTTYGQWPLREKAVWDLSHSCTSDWSSVQRETKRKNFEDWSTANEATNLIWTKDISLGYRIQKGVCNLSGSPGNQHTQRLCLQIWYMKHHCTRSCNSISRWVPNKCYGQTLLRRTKLYLFQKIERDSQLMTACWPIRWHLKSSASHVPSMHLIVQHAFNMAADNGRQVFQSFSPSWTTGSCKCTRNPSKGRITDPCATHRMVNELTRQAFC